MGGWIINIVGMIFIGVILDVILPTGKTNSFIKMVFSIFLLYVIVSPLPKLFNNSINLNTNTSIIDTNYLINLNLQKISTLENDIILTLKNNGYENVSVIVNANIYSEEFKINKIHVDLINMVLKNKDEHININNNIVTIIRNITGIKEENIILYE